MVARSGILIALIAASLHFVANSLLLRGAPSVGDLNHNETNHECDLSNLPMYVLNLDKRPEKLRSMEHAIERDAPWMCNQTCRVDAPWGNLWGHLGSRLRTRIIDDQKWQKIRSTRQIERIAGHTLTPGSIALMVGHGRMWEHVVQDEAPFAIVMEDDLSKFHPDVKSFLCKITQNRSLRDGWDFMIMQHHDPEQFVDPLRAPSIQKGHVYNTGMYIIKLDAARKALQTMFPINSNVQIDSPTSPFWTHLRGVFTVPSIADASHEITDVQQYLITKTSVSNGCTIRNCKPLDTARMIIPELLNPVKDKGY